MPTSIVPPGLAGAAAPLVGFDALLVDDWVLEPELLVELELELPHPAMATATSAVAAARAQDLRARERPADLLVIASTLLCCEGNGAGEPSRQLVGLARAFSDGFACCSQAAD